MKWMAGWGEGMVPGEGLPPIWPLPLKSVLQLESEVRSLTCTSFLLSVTFGKET